MALFPKCTFALSLAQPAVAGTRLTGTVTVDAPEDIPRAEALELIFQTEARAVYGSGKNRTVKRATVFSKSLSSRLAGALPRGAHALPFDIDLPPWIPPALDGPRCSIEHKIGVRLDVDWAIDPDASFSPVIALPPRHAVATPALVRSDPSFHPSLIVEIALSSTTVVQGGHLEGSIAVRGAEEGAFDGIELGITDYATIAFARGDRREHSSARYRWAASELQGGRSVPFRIGVDAAFPPTFTNGFIDHDLVLAVRLDVPWRTDPTFVIPIELLPAGSQVDGAPSAMVVGNERMQLLAQAMARVPGLRMGRYPVLVEGELGAVHMRVVDSPLGSRLGVEVDLQLPSVDLGLTLRQKGLFDLGSSSLLPEALARDYVLRRAEEDGSAPIEDAAVAAFVEAVTANLEDAADIRLADHRLAFHLAIHEDTESTYQGVARLAVAKAKQVLEAVAALPPPAAIDRRAWEAMAAEQRALLVPSRPALHGVVLAARVLGGDERALQASLRAVWEEARPVGVEWSVDLRAMPLPAQVLSKLAEATLADAAPALASHFAEAQIEGTTVVLRADGWHEDPRAWMPGLEAFFAWALETRGERTSQSAYR